MSPLDHAHPEALTGGPDRWWLRGVRAAATADDFHLAYGLRYRVYVEECGKPYPTADHERRRLSDTLDSDSHVLLAERGGVVLGTVRCTLGTVPAFWEKYADLLDLAALEAEGRHAVAYSSRLVVDAAVRGQSRVAVALMVAIYEWALKAGVRVCVCHTVERLVPLMERMGWQRRGQPFAHPDSGTQQVPMVLWLLDLDHLTASRSPMLQVWEAQVESKADGKRRDGEDPSRRSRLCRQRTSSLRRRVT